MRSRFPIPRSPSAVAARRAPAVKCQRATGFTLLESIVALAVAAIALPALLQLQLVSMRTAARAEWTGRAVLLAQEKLAEALRAGYPPLGIKSGVVESEAGPFTWQLEVAEARVPLSYRRPAGRDRLRRISVAVTAPPAGGQHINMTTLVADNAIRGT